MTAPVVRWPQSFLDCGGSLLFTHTQVIGKDWVAIDLIIAQDYRKVKHPVHGGWLAALGGCPSVLLALTCHAGGGEGQVGWGNHGWQEGRREAYVFSICMPAVQQNWMPLQERVSHRTMK